MSRRPTPPIRRLSCAPSSPRRTAVPGFLGDYGEPIGTRETRESMSPRVTRSPAPAARPLRGEVRPDPMMPERPRLPRRRRIGRPPPRQVSQVPHVPDSTSPTPLEGDIRPACAWEPRTGPPGNRLCGGAISLRGGAGRRPRCDVLLPVQGLHADWLARAVLREVDEAYLVSHVYGLPGMLAPATPGGPPGKRDQRGPGLTRRSGERPCCCPWAAVDETSPGEVYLPPGGTKAMLNGLANLDRQEGKVKATY